MIKYSSWDMDCKIGLGLYLFGKRFGVYIVKGPGRRKPSIRTLVRMKKNLYAQLRRKMEH